MSVRDGEYAGTEQPGARSTGEFSVGDSNPGASFHDAPMVAPGTYGGNLAFMDAHYYRIPVGAGQELHATAMIQKATYQAHYHGLARVYQTFRVVVYDQDFSRVAEQHFQVDGNPKIAVPVSANWVADHDTIAYVGVSASHNHNDGGTGSVTAGLPEQVDPATYELSLQVEADEADQFDVRNIPTFEATPAFRFPDVEPFDVPGMAGGDLKLDEAIYYGVNSHRGETLRISAAVAKPWYEAWQYGLFAGQARYMLVIYNDAFEKIGEESIAVVGNRPDGQTLVADVNVDLDGIVYIGIGCENTGADPVEEPRPGWVTVQALRTSTDAVEPAAEAHQSGSANGEAAIPTVSRAQELSDQAYSELSDKNYDTAADLYKEAMIAWQRIVMDNPDDANAEDELARCRTNFSYALSQPPYIALGAGDEQFEQGAYAEAEETFESAIEGYKEAHRRLGAEEFSQNLHYARSKHAQACFARVVQTDGVEKAVDTMVDLHEEEIKRLRQILVDAPENPDATKLLAELTNIRSRAIGNRLYGAISEADNHVSDKEYFEAAALYRCAIDGYVQAHQRLETDEFAQNLTYARQQYGLASFQNALLNEGVAHAFDLESFGRGRVRLSDYRGKTVLVAIWTSDCGYCQAEIPALQEFYDRHEGDGLVVIGLNADPVWNGGRVAEAQQLVAHDVSFPQAWANQETIHHFGNPMSVPSMFWIDTEGRLAKVVDDRDHDQLARDLAEIMSPPK